MGNDEEQQPTNQLPEGAGGEEADLHTLVPDNLFRQAERPGRLRDALEARAAALNYSVESVFHRLLANCFIRREHRLPGSHVRFTSSRIPQDLDILSKSWPAMTCGEGRQRLAERCGHCCMHAQVLGTAVQVACPV